MQVVAKLAIPFLFFLKKKDKDNTVGKIVVIWKEALGKRDLENRVIWPESRFSPFCSSVLLPCDRWLYTTSRERPFIYLRQLSSATVGEKQLLVDANRFEPCRCRQLLENFTPRTLGARPFSYFSSCRVSFPSQVYSFMIIFGSL